MLSMSTFFKVQMGQNRVITGVSAVDPTVRVVKRLISVKTIGFYIVSPVGKVIFNSSSHELPQKFVNDQICFFAYPYICLSNRMINMPPALLF